MALSRGGLSYSLSRSHDVWVPITLNIQQGLWREGRSHTSSRVRRGEVSRSKIGLV